MLLSEIKLGELFKFVAGQIIYYLNGSGPHVNEYETNGFTLFVVLKKNEKSVKCRPVDGRVEYTFKFSGEANWSDKVELKNPKIIKCDPE